MIRDWFIQLKVRGVGEVCKGKTCERTPSERLPYGKTEEGDRTEVPLYPDPGPSFYLRVRSTKFVSLKLCHLTKGSTTLQTFSFTFFVSPISSFFSSVSILRNPTSGM